MNRFPLWKYVLIGITLVVAFLYTLPNFFGEVPAVQVSPMRTTEKVDAALLGKVESSLKAAGLGYQGVELAGNSIKVRLASTDLQIKAKDVLQTSLGEPYTVALNLVSASPAWLSSIHALPMYLGLDLRGGVHFLLEVDMKAALEKAAIRYQNDFRTELRGDKIRYGAITRDGSAVTVHFATRDQRDAALNKLSNAFGDLAFTSEDLADGFTLTAHLKPRHAGNPHGRRTGRPDRDPAGPDAVRRRYRHQPRRREDCREKGRGTDRRFDYRRLAGL